jgi:hypothetical protein
MMRGFIEAGTFTSRLERTTYVGVVTRQPTEKSPGIIGASLSTV